MVSHARSRLLNKFNNMKISASELASLLGGSVEGDAAVIVDRPARIEEATPGTLSFLANPKYEEFAYQSEASILLVDRLFKPSRPIKATLVRVDNVYAAMAFLAERFDVSATHQVSISSNAVVDSSCKNWEGCYHCRFCRYRTRLCNRRWCRVASLCICRSQKHYWSSSPSCILESKYITTARSVEGVTIHANSVIGSDGFGYVKTDGMFQKNQAIG